jgi:excinuclease UvrABC nuclease subunit
MVKPVKFQPVSAGFLADLIGAKSAWPAFVRALAGKSGVYIIRAAESGRVLYVGESHTGRLKKTLLRHFQAWSGKTAGQRYSRGAVEIAAEVTPADRAVARQDALILAMQPRDNSVSPAGPLDENPF